MGVDGKQPKDHSVWKVPQEVRLNKWRLAIRAEMLVLRVERVHMPDEVQP